MVHKAQEESKKVVYPEGEEEKIIRAAHVCYTDNIAKPILLGNFNKIIEIISDLDYDEKEFEVFLIGKPVRDVKDMRRHFLKRGGVREPL